MQYNAGSNTFGGVALNATATNKYLQQVSSGVAAFVQPALADLSDASTVATVSGAGGAVFTITGATAITLPTSGTMVTSTVAALSSLTTIGAFPITTASVTSGGIPYFSSTTVMASSGLLTASDIVKGGGAGAAPSSWGSQAANTFIAGPVSGSAAVVTSRALDPLDLTPTFVYASAQFDATTDVTLNDIPGLTFTLVAGKTYHFRVQLLLNADLTGGYRVGIGGTATATLIAGGFVSTQNNVSPASTRFTSVGQIITNAVTVADNIARIEGVIVVNAGGTFTITFAENASSGTSSVLVGSSLQML